MEKETETRDRWQWHIYGVLLGMTMMWVFHYWRKIAVMDKPQEEVQKRSKELKFAS